MTGTPLHRPERSGDAGPGHAIRGAAGPRGPDLAAGSLLARNVTFNVIGWVVPAACALVALPATARALGPARFGLLSLAWALAGHLSTLDLGIGRALTQVVAARLGRRSPEHLARLVWTAAPLLAVIASVAALAWLAVAGPLATRVLRAPAAVQADAVQASRWFAVVVACVVLSSGTRGLLEAGQRFGTINALRAPTAVFTYLGPLLALPFAAHERRLSAGIAVLAAGRIVLVAAQLAACWRDLPWLRRAVRPSGAAARRLLQAGGWLTVSNLVNPVLVTVDRFALGALVSAAAAGYYAAAYEVATKMWIVTGALCPVLFPAIAATARTQPARAGTLVARGARVLVVVLFPAALAMVMAGRTVLATWVSPAFSEFGARSLSLLAIGIFINGVGQAAFTALQAAGRARATAFAHVAQFLPFVAALWLVAPRFGASGVAAVTLVRLAVDASVMWVVAARALPDARSGLIGAAAYTLGAVTVLAAGALAEARLPGWGRAAYAGVGVAVHLAVSWRFLLPHGERVTARLAVLRVAGPRRLDPGARAA